MSDALFLLLDAGDLEVAWDLCEERGWFLPGPAQRPQGGLPSQQKAGGRHPGSHWRKRATTGGLLSSARSGIWYAAMAVWWPGHRLW